VIEPGHGDGLVVVVADLVELPLGAGADQETISMPRQGVDQDAGPEDLAGNAVAADPVDRVVAGRGRS